MSQQDNSLLPNPLFTVATITYNSANWVEEAIRSVLSSRYIDFEYIIADDASTDNTWDLINKYTDERIVSFRNETNIGEYNNRNRVLDLAKGKFIIYIDGDDILYKDTLLKYATLLNHYPNAKGIWGVQPLDFNFVVLPYLFTKEQLTLFNYLSTRNICYIGFSDSLFEVEALKQIGGMKTEYSIGDVYLKKKFCCFNSVVLIPYGNAFWRQSENQASQKMLINNRNQFETFEIDKAILNDSNIPLTEEQLKIAKNNFLVRSVKLMVANTLMNGKIKLFVKMFYSFNLSVFDLLKVFSKGKYSYTGGGSSSKPLLDSYHFKSEN